MPFSALRRRRTKPLSPELEAELRSPLPWMYPWDLGAEVRLVAPGLPSVHETRRAMIEPVVREAIAAAGPDASVLDLGCNEGWFAHRALEWGAARVVGLDVREANVRRARLIAAHHGLDRVRFERADVYELDPDAFGTFDVVLVLGLIYHLENPIGALRVARALTRGIVLVESQLTDHNDDIRLGWGTPGEFRTTPAHWAAVLEPIAEQDDEGNTLASFGGVLSLVPNRAALLQSLEVVGFTDARMLDAPAGSDVQYVDGHRGIAAGRSG